MSIRQRLSLLACMLFGWGCKQFSPLAQPQRTLVEPITVTRGADGEYVLHFERPGPHRISVAASEALLRWDQADYTAKGDEFTLPDTAPGKRLFFGVTGPDDRRRIVTERLLPLRGALNVRDLGGLPAGDSLRTRWGVLYRAGHLADLTRTDLAYLRGLDLQTVVDFRSDFEIDKHPNDYLKTLPLDYRQIPIGDKAGNVQQALRRQIRTADPETFDSRAFVADLNRQFVDTLAHQYAPFMALLTESGRAPIMWYCSAGKDRTGFATAIVLDALGVDRALIMDDFMMSNFYRYEKNLRNLRRATLAGVDQRIAQPLLEVDCSYLQNAFDEIDRKFGGTPAFLEAELGVDEAGLARLRKRFLVRVE